MTILRGDRVLLERRRLNLNQEVLAGQIGVDRTYISRIELN
jgi:transcriptional regulator with XRE-family HTH domain